MAEPRFVSERIDPLPGRFEAAAMVRGEPGLPAGFAWNGVEHHVAERLEAGKRTGAMRGNTGGERYVRRHTFVLRMDDGAIWETYCTRQPPIAWYLYRIRA